MYSFVERLGLSEKDNLIDYNTGVFKIKLDIQNKKIIAKTNSLWEKHIEDFVKASKIAWKYEDKDFAIHDNSVIIKLNYDILLNYLDTIIVFI